MTYFLVGTLAVKVPRHIQAHSILEVLQSQRGGWMRGAQQTLAELACAPNPVPGRHLQVKSKDPVSTLKTLRFKVEDASPTEEMSQSAIGLKGKNRKCL